MTDDSVKENEPVEGLVAGILTERELAINIGSDQGVVSGMKFQVRANTPTEIRDPNTNEVLGSIIQEKVRVKATRVEPKFSICRTYEVRETEGGRFSIGIGLPSGLFDPPRRIPETLKAEDADYLPELPEEESFVKIGDRVVQILNED